MLVTSVAANRLRLKKHLPQKPSRLAGLYASLGLLSMSARATFLQQHLDSGFVILLAISQGAYLTSKNIKGK